MEFSKECYFGIGEVPIGIGAQLKGWDVQTDHMRDPDKIPVVDFRAMTEMCPHNCSYCFTKDESRAVPKTISIGDIKYVIDQLADFGTHAINYVGEGEPMMDNDFFEIVEYTSGRGIIPVIFTDGATKRMRNRDDVRRIFASGASVVPKCDSLFDKDYQNEAVCRDGKSDPNYFDRRAEAIKIMIEEGFSDVSKDGTTRMGFDTLVTKNNIHEVPGMLRYCRKNNFWAAFSFYIPSGMCKDPNFDRSRECSDEDKSWVRKTIQTIDKNEYGFDHYPYTNFITQACVEFMQIRGDGKVTPCPGNDMIVGDIKRDAIADIKRMITGIFPVYRSDIRSGNCPPRDCIDVKPRK